MTNTQLLLSIGIPSLLVVLSWISNNTRLTTLERRFDGLERRLEGVDQKVEGVVDSNHRDALEIMRAMTALHERVAVVEAKQAS